MNKIILVGRITQDLELRSTKNGTYVCDFTLAVNRNFKKEGESEADFIRCTVFGNQAENLHNYMKKGSQIGVVGELRVDSWKNEKDEWQNKTYVIVSQVEFLEKREKTDNEKIQSKDWVNEIISSEDLPF